MFCRFSICRRMKGALFVLLAAVVAPQMAEGAIIDWTSGATINNDAISASGEHHIRIKGNVNMNGFIQIQNGATVYVEIHPDVAGPVTLKNTGSAESFFRVEQNCKLIIKGKDNSHRIIMDGGSVSGTDKSTTYEMIGSAGTLEMQYVTVQNNHNTKTDNFYGAIKLNPGWADNQKLGTTTIKNCTFQNCTAMAGPVLFTEAKNDPLGNPANTPTSCAILMEDVVIDGCKANSADGRPDTDPSKDTDPGSGWGGILRFRGSWPGNFTMKHVEIKNCTAEYSCAGVFWNAMGDKTNTARQPKLTVIGCKFHDNSCKRSGGAMRIETFCEFKDELTEIYNNTAGIMGGGIHMYGYAGGNLGKFDFNYYLTDVLSVHDNTAQYGAGLGFQLTKGCQLEAGSTFNLHFNGAKINDNHATVKGGGVYLENRSDAAKNYKINFYLNRGELNGNQVYKDNNENWNTWWSGTFYDTKNSGGTVTAEEDYKSCGGAVYVYNSNIGYEPGAAGTLNMNNNRCMRRGGAVCVTGTKASVKLSSLTASRNMAQDGGALTTMSPTDTPAENYSVIELDDMTLDQNTSNGWGGTVLVERGKLVVNNAKILNSSTYRGGGIYSCNQSIINIGNATISGNKSTDLGGGIYIQDQSNLTLGSATISGNSATNRGGAIYSTGTSSLTMGDATVTGNSAKFGGGLCSESGSKSEIGSATFDTNVAWSNGGAMYLEKGGTLNITTGATFTNNQTVDGGGAICVKVNNNTTSEYISGTIKNATFRGNKAYRGGAIEFDGKDNANSVSFTLENNVMENNVAKLGGALLINEAKVTYNGGKIRWNKAEYVEGGPKTSFGYFPYAWNDNCYKDKTFSGFGGGIIVAKDGVLTISKSYPFGIYENRADIGGNDISTVCSDWSVYKGDSPMREAYKYYPGTLTIPNADNLDLTGFTVPVPRTAISWMEDYNAADGAYSVAGTHKLSSPQRYSDLLKTSDGMKQLSKAMVNPESTTKKYLHLTMGYNFVFVKLKKIGLKEGETAIFRVSYRANDTDPYKQYMDFTITGKEGGVDVEKTIALTVGKWKIEETDWAYTYTRPAAQEFELKQEDALSGTVKELSFSNTKNEGKHDAESTKVNKIEIK